MRTTAVGAADCLAKQRGGSKQAAVRQAVQAELDRDASAVPLVERLKQVWAEHPKPPPTGQPADKEFDDDLSGGL